MPEIAEVARIVHYIRKYLVNNGTLAHVSATDDPNVYGKVGTSAGEFQKCLTGKKIIGAGQQGKYFWMEMSSPPHPLMHFGMTGWLKIKSEDTYYYRPKEGAEKEEWPPRFVKFLLKTDSNPPVEAAFVDSRRFARIRLLHCPADQIRKIEPLSVNGPDPVVDSSTVTEPWLIDLCRNKKVPIKALLLDQANISGIGNWVGDEIFYAAKIHPEQYSNTLSDPQLKQLHRSIHDICGTAVELLADSERFPDHWLFKHRWGKGKKDAPTRLPNGEKIVFLTVGGRTSAVIPSVQKKTGPVAKEVSDTEGDGGRAGKSGGGGKKRKSNKKTTPTVDSNADSDDALEEEKAEENEKPPPAKKQKKSRKKSAGKKGRKNNDDDDDDDDDDNNNDDSDADKAEESEEVNGNINGPPAEKSAKTKTKAPALPPPALPQKKKKNAPKAKATAKATAAAPPPPPTSTQTKGQGSKKKKNFTNSRDRDDEEEKKKKKPTMKEKEKEKEKATANANVNANVNADVNVNGNGSTRRRSARFNK